MSTSVSGSIEIAGAVSFGQKLAGSDAFKSLFREGMYLVELSAAYLDGPGRLESKALPRATALAYASESMRLTTRLMQLASWLLMQRAVNEGDLTPAQARRLARALWRAADVVETATAGVEAVRTIVEAVNVNPIGEALLPFDGDVAEAAGRG